MHLLCCLVLYAAFFRFEFIAVHVSNVLNTAADAISHNNISLFVFVPQIPRIAIPQAEVDLHVLIVRRPDWGSRDWTESFTASLIRESRQPEQSTSCRLLGPSTTLLPMVVLGHLQKLTCLRAKRLPITPHLLRKIHKVWAQGPPSFNYTMLWAACCICLFVFCSWGPGNLPAPLHGPQPNPHSQ